MITFDKDDVDTLDFVAASANLRSVVFGIETKSKFDIKRKLSGLMSVRSKECACVLTFQKWLEISSLLLPRRMP